MLEGQQTNEAWHCHCYAGKEELKPEPSAAMEKVPPLLQLESSGRKQGAGLLLEGVGVGNWGVDVG